MKIIEKDEVFEKLDMNSCIKLMKEALSDLDKGKAAQPLRAMYKLPGGETFGFMPAYLGSDTCYGAKVVVACPQNVGTTYPSHSGYVMIFDSAHGQVKGLADAGAITQIRTGAVSAVATDLLSRKDSKTLAIIGCGAQGRSHLEAILLVRDIKLVKVYDLRMEASEKYKQEMEAKFHVQIEICNSVEECVKDADIVCTLTNAKSAYLKAEWIKPGTHINAVGTFTPSTAEVCPELFTKAKVYCDNIEACKKESGEYLDALKQGLVDETILKGSIGDIINNVVEGRTNDQEITMFDALGMAIEDVACGKFLCL